MNSIERWDRLKWPIQKIASPFSLPCVLAWAISRWACKSKKLRDQTMKTTPFAPHYNGCLAEFLAQKIFGGVLDLEPAPEGTGHRPDLITDDGLKIEVKSSAWHGKDAMLKLEQNELFVDYWYVLAVVDLPDVANIYPPIPYSDLMSNYHMSNFGKGPRYCLSDWRILEIHEANKAARQEHEKKLLTAP